MKNSGEMPFLDHIRELRYRLLIVLSFLIVISIIGYNFTDLLISLLIENKLLINKNTIDKTIIRLLMALLLHLHILFKV